MRESFTSFTISYDECSDSVVSLLPIAIDSSTRKFETNVYNPLAEILVYTILKTIFIGNTSDKMEENNRILKKFISRINKSTDYNTIITEDDY